MLYLSFIFLICLVLYGTAQSEGDLEVLVDPIGITKYNFVRKTDGYEFSFELENGSYRWEVGRYLNLGTDAEELVIKGEYGRVYYESHFGKRDSIKYTADKNGYRPTIARAAWLSAAPQLQDISSKLLSSLTG